MIALPIRRIFLARAVMDMRKSFDSLIDLVQHHLAHDPHTGDAFVFVSRDRRRLKVLLWDRDGFWVLAKRLECGAFALPLPALVTSSREALELDHAAWALLLEGITMLAAKRSRHYAHIPAHPVAVSSR